MSSPQRPPGGTPARARLNLVADCYYHAGSMAHYLCGVCGRTLCDAHRRFSETGDRCRDCPLDAPEAWWICGRCGWLAPAETPECGACGQRDGLARRLPPLPAFWEVRYRGHSLGAAPLIGGTVAVGALTLGLYPALNNAARFPAGGRWILYLITVSGLTGLLAALVERQRAAFELVLSSDGVSLAWRHRQQEAAAPWEDILGLELTRSLATAQFRMLSPLTIMPAPRSFRGYREAVTRIRQHAAVAPTPFRAW